MHTSTVDDDEVIELSEEDMIAVRIAAWTEVVLTAQRTPAEAAEVAAFTRDRIAATLNRTVARHLATFTDGELAATIDAALDGDADALSPSALAAHITTRMAAFSTHDKATTRVAALADARPMARAIQVSTRIAALVAAAEGEKVTRRMALLSYAACQRSRRAAGTIEPAQLTPPAQFPTGSGRLQTRMASLQMPALEAPTDTVRMSPLEIEAAMPPLAPVPRRWVLGAMIAGSITLAIGVIAALW